MLSSEPYISALFSKTVNPDVLSNFETAKSCRDHPLFSDKSKLSVKFQLFYDGIGTSNPLRGSSTLYIVGVFYYTILNLPESVSSTFPNVHLLAVCYSHDLKTYGFDPILSKFASEMKGLALYGISGDFPVVGPAIIYAGLAQLVII